MAAECHENYHSFGSLDRYGLASTIIQGAIVALPDCLAYALDDCAVIADNGMPFELDTPQFSILHTGLDS